MRKEDKLELVQDLTKKFKENNIFYLLDASGLSVDQVNSFRESCFKSCLLYTSPSPRDRTRSRMPSSA